MPFIHQLVYKCKGEIDHEPLNFVHARACEHACAYIPHRAPTPTHLHGLLQVLRDVLKQCKVSTYNHVNTLTSRGHHT